MGFHGEINKLLEAGKAEAAKLQLTAKQTVYKVLMPTVPTVIRLLEAVETSGPDKKVVALDYVGKAYDAYIATINVPGPDRVVHAVLKEMVLLAAGEIIDLVVTLAKSPELLELLNAFHPLAQTPEAQQLIGQLRLGS